MKKVGIVMGSDSDLPIIKKATDMLTALSIEYEVHIYSAHRTPDEARDFARNARKNGFGAIIAAAGMAAHLAGAIAANTTLPVIGIPCKSSVLDGMDALLSTVQMPTGIPVATVAINGGANAGLLAAKILATSDADILAKLKDYSAKLKDQVVAKDAKLQEIGYKAYDENGKLLKGDGCMTRDIGSFDYGDTFEFAFSVPHGTAKVEFIDYIAE